MVSPLVPPSPLVPSFPLVPHSPLVPPSPMVLAPLVSPPSLVPPSLLVPPSPLVPLFSWFLLLLRIYLPPPLSHDWMHVIPSRNRNMILFEDLTLSEENISSSSVSFHLVDLVPGYPIIHIHSFYSSYTPPSPTIGGGGGEGRHFPQFIHSPFLKVQ